jgi:hypothetical protein
MFECLNTSCRKTFTYPAILIANKSQDETVEFHVCPYCYNKDIAEIHEPFRLIESIQSVKINEADELIKKGYEIKDTYASSVTMVKYAVPPEKKEAAEEKPSLPESQAAIDKDSEQLRKDLKDLTGQ